MKVYKNRKAGEKILETYDMLLKEWGCAFTEKDLQTEYGTTHVIEAGKEDGEPMVQEVAILFDNSLWRGNRSTKMSADNFNAFRSYNYPPLARV